MGSNTRPTTEFPSPSSMPQPPDEKHFAPNAEVHTFSDPAVPLDLPSTKEQSRRQNIRLHLTCALTDLFNLAAPRIKPPPPPPRNPAETSSRPDAAEWRRARDSELTRHGSDLRTGTETPKATEKPLPYIMAFRAEANLFGGLERRKVRCAIGRDILRLVLDLDATRTASHMPLQAGRRFQPAVAVPEGHAANIGISPEPL